MAVTGVDDELWDEFHRLVNMPSQELHDWLRTEEAGAGGQPEPPLGKRVLAVLGKRREDLDSADILVMRETIADISALRAKWPDRAEDQARWRSRLMSLGHDPVRGGAAPIRSGKAEQPAPVTGMSSAEVARRRGPFVSLYLDATHDTEDAARRQELSWRFTRERLEQAGAPDETVALLDDAITGGEPVPGRRGRVLIADTEAVLVDQPVARPPVREIVRVSPLPYLLPLIEYEAGEVPHVVAVVDRLGSELYGVDAHGNPVAETVEGSGHPVHRVRGGGLSHLSMRRRAEETVRRNIDEVAEELTRLARSIQAEVVVLSGEVGARTALRRALGTTTARIVETEVGGRAEGIDPDALDDRVHDIVAEEARRHRDDVVERFTAERGRDHGLAVSGLPATASALLTANTDNLLVNAEKLGDRTVTLDPEVLRDPDAFGAAATEGGTCRADEALPVAALVRGGTVTPVTADAAPMDGVGALLRHV
ncbi:baeRF2 domain-containing protein [Nocardia brevicatena]|uniref:Rv2629 family ribosome hibernation factor n=1 Tax=Nocardia brevicatena TaxID=37327 RepID=UPI00030733D9|nr:DUF3140 domain-containing protein [Nocardia brevicatena]